MADGKQATGRGTRILLYVSLALNFAVAGLVIGALLMGGHNRDERRPARSGETGLGPLIFALEPEDRRALGRGMRETLRESHAGRGEMRAAFSEFGALLRAEPFDTAAAGGVLERQFAETEFRLSLAQSLFLARIAGMSAVERAAYADRLEDHLSRNGKRHGKGGGS